MKRSMLLFIGAIMIVMFQNCTQSVNFKQEDPPSVTAGVDNEVPAPEAPPSEPALPGNVQHFKVVFGSEASPLDMIWVIDNSSSMSQEVALVRYNFDAFLSALNKSTNFRLLLISGTEARLPAYGVTVPLGFDSKTHKQIGEIVGSYDGPEQVLKGLKNAEVAGFFRSESKKIIVFVSDDNSLMNANKFLTSLGAYEGWSPKDVSIFSFIAQGKTVSPCQAGEGVVYKDLAAQTGGKTYNICLPDWTESFADLMTKSVSKAIRRFSINTPSVKEILELRVEGKVVGKSLYSLNGKMVVLDDSVELLENSQVEIRYE